MKKITLIFTIFLLYTSAMQGAVALERQSHEEAVTFSEDEYQAYMDRIEQLNPEIHAKLKHYKDVFQEPAFLKAAALEPATVLIPTQKSHGQPMIVLPSLISDEELERYLASYKALTRKFIPGKHDFSDAEYQHYMNLIKEIDPTMYKNLRKYEWETGNRNLSNALDEEEDVIFPDDSPSNTYYFVNIKSMLNKTEDHQKDHLKDLLEKFAKYKAEYSDSDDNENDDECNDGKPLDEYEEYMKLIAKISPSAYAMFREYEKSPGHYKKIIQRSLSLLDCLDDTMDVIRISPDAMILAPHESNKWNPIIIMDPMYGLSEAEKIKKLTPIIKKFCEVVNAHRVHTATLFPKDEYLKYMEIIKTLDESVYENLTACEEKLGKPCVRVHEGKMFKIIPPSDKTHGYPLILLPRDIEKHQHKRIYLEHVIQKYNQAYALTKEQKKVLRIIKDLAPELYAELMTVNPIGKDHIIIHGNHTGINKQTHDGLPLFIVSYSDAMERPEDQLRFILGHELSHYVQDDYEDFYQVPPTHKAMRGNETLPQEYTPGKGISSQLPFEETFKKARSRTKEYKADASSVMRFGTNIDAAIALLQNQAMRLEKSYEITKQPLPTTFTTTHPLHKDRIAHLESLRSEVEHRKASGQKPAPIDWKALIEKYKKTD